VRDATIRKDGGEKGEGTTRTWNVKRTRRKNMEGRMVSTRAAWADREVERKIPEIKERLLPR